MIYNRNFQAFSDGVVAASWTTKDTVKDWNKGSFFFTIIGGKANATSSNRLTLSGK